MDDIYNDSLKTLKEIKDNVFNLNKEDLISDDSEFSIEHAVEHAASLHILKEKFSSGLPLYLGCFKDTDNDSVMMMINNSKLSESDNNICIWRATNEKINSVECVKSIMSFTACMLTVIGHDVYTLEKNEYKLFSPLFAGKGEYVSKS